SLRSSRLDRAVTTTCETARPSVKARESWAFRAADALRIIAFFARNARRCRSRETCGELTRGWHSPPIRTVALYDPTITAGGAERISGGVLTILKSLPGRRRSAFAGNGELNHEEYGAGSCADHAGRLRFNHRRECEYRRTVRGRGF